MTGVIKVNNWDELTHYKDRRPIWIKLHLALFSNYKFTSMKPEHQSLLLFIWAICAENGTGECDFDLEMLRDKTRRPKLATEDLKAIENKGFIVLLATCYQDAPNESLTPEQLAILEKKRIEEEKKREEQNRARAIIDLLNEITGRSFTYSDPNIALAKARLAKGYTEEDFRAVFKFKQIEWANDSEKQQYLRPETLLGNKFEGYLQATKAKTKRSNQGLDFNHDEIPL